MDLGKVIANQILSLAHEISNLKDENARLAAWNREVLEANRGLLAENEELRKLFNEWAPIVERETSPSENDE